MSDIKSVRVYETPDGVRHDTFHQAQAWLRNQSAYQELLEYMRERYPRQCELWGGRLPSIEDFVMFLQSNASFLANVLKRLR